MATVKISDTTLGGTGEIAASYIYPDEGAVVNQTGADNTKPSFFENRIINIKVPNSFGGFHTPPILYNTTVLIASRPDGTPLNEPDSKVGLPCPPYCDKE